MVEALVVYVFIMDRVACVRGELFKHLNIFRLPNPFERMLGPLDKLHRLYVWVTLNLSVKRFLHR